MGRMGTWSNRIVTFGKLVDYSCHTIYSTSPLFMVFKVMTQFICVISYIFTLTQR